MLWVHAHPLQGNDGRSAGSRHPSSCRGRSIASAGSATIFFWFEKYFLKVPGSSSYYGSYGWWGSSEHTVSNSIDIAIMIFLMIISGYNVYGIDIDTSLSISVMFTQLLTPGGLHR